MCCSKDLKHPSNFRDLKYLILNKHLVDVSTRTGWLNFKTVNISILNETQETKITFSAPKSYRVFREMGHSFMISFQTLCCKLVIVQHQHWKKNRIEKMILSLPGSWSQLSHWWSCNILFGIFHKSFLFFLSLFFFIFWGIPIPFIPLEWQAFYSPNSITPESSFNLLTRKSDKHLISPQRITPKSNIKFRRIRDRKLKQLLIVKQILLVNISGNV